MLQAALIGSNVLVLVLMLLVLARAVRYVRRHPELFTSTVPVGYVRCQRTLRRVIERSKALAGGELERTSIVWQAPGGLRLTLDASAVEARRGDGGGVRMRWDDVGGVGVRMQPEFRFVDADGDRRPDVQQTVGYSFHVLVVPLSGSTLSFTIPTDGQPEPVEFAARLLALAGHHQKRINVFGFDRAPAPPRRKMPKH